jgi:hypothetical protein
MLFLLHEHITILCTQGPQTFFLLYRCFKQYIPSTEGSQTFFLPHRGLKHFFLYSYIDASNILPFTWRPQPAILPNTQRTQIFLPSTQMPQTFLLLHRCFKHSAFHRESSSIARSSVSPHYSSFLMEVLILFLSKAYKNSPST